MIKIADRVKETTTSTGTGTINLGGAATGFRTFVAGVGGGAEVYYAIVGQAGETCEGEWEMGIGTVTDASPDTLSRDTVLSSSNAGSKVNFSSGTKDVALSIPAKAPVMLTEVLEPSDVATLDIDISGCETVKVVGWLKPATDSVRLYTRVSNDGGSSFREGASDYRWSSLINLTCDYFVANESNGSSFWDAGYLIGNAAGEYVSIDITVTNPATASVKTTYAGTICGTEVDGWYTQCSVSGEVTTAEVNDAIRFLFSSGNIADGRLAVYRYPAP